jgi:hypothetical protein
MTSAQIPISRPRLIDVAPGLVTELQRQLFQQNEFALVDQVAELVLVDRCQCGDGFCASFDTVPRPVGSFGQGHRTIPLWSETGILNVDIVRSAIGHIEVLYRADFRSKLLAAMA